MKTHSCPENHWKCSSPLPYKQPTQFGEFIHLCGHVDLDAQVAQTKIALANIEAVLCNVGARIGNIVNVTIFYKGSASADALHQYLTIRSIPFQSPGPATSGLPIPYLVHENMAIEIEVIAIAYA